MKLKRNDVVAVLWEDAVSDPAWMSSEKAESYQLDKIMSVGYFINKDRKAFRISTSISGSQRDVTVIPCGWVIEVRKLNPKGTKI